MGNWALAALVPGVLSLIAVPWVMSKIYAPTITKTPEAPAYARSELALMGRMSACRSPSCFCSCCGSSAARSGSPTATTAAVVGVAILLVTGVLTWKDMAKNSSAWSTLIFFSVLVGMAEQLNRLGVITWIGDGVAVLVPGMPWMLAFAILTLAYFYAHYFFASNTAQIVAMYAFFLTAAVAAGASWFARRAPR